MNVLGIMHCHVSSLFAAASTLLSVAARASRAWVREKPMLVSDVTASSAGGAGVGMAANPPPPPPPPPPPAAPQPAEPPQPPRARTRARCGAPDPEMAALSKRVPFEEVRDNA